MVESYGKSGNAESLRQRVFALLDENPCLTAKPLCELLELPYEQSYRYLNKLKNEWKSSRQNEQGSNCSNIHGWHGYCCVPYYVNRKVAVEVGWVRTKSRNRWLLWKDKYGRMEWFENGKVNLWVRKPVNLGHIYQLVCNGFGKTDLIKDGKILQQVLATITEREVHRVFYVGITLPKVTIDFFREKYGFTIKLGDKSHPKSVEVISGPPDWLDKARGFSGNIFYDKDFFKKPDYVV